MAALAALAATSARADTPPAPAPPPLTWIAPSPAEGSTLQAQAGTAFSFAVAASDATTGATVHVAATSLPAGATLTAVDGNPGTATVNWTPTAAQTGGAVVSFTATDNASTPAPPITLTFTIEVAPPPPAPPLVQLTDDKVARWAFVLKPAVVRAQPDPSSAVVTRLQTVTSDQTQNLVLALQQRTDENGVWVQARLPILPNNTTGWIRRSDLGAYRLVHTHLYVDRGLQTAVLMRDGQPIFRARVGVGKPYWPTPRGEFYIRDLLINFTDTFYGPAAFGTSARSAVLTDWPGGGFVGVHGTSLPQLIPGRISHGCIRLRNPDILRLKALMPVGSPLTIT